LKHANRRHDEEGCKYNGYVNRHLHLSRAHAL
jgi:hypothetical protein